MRFHAQAEHAVRTANLATQQICRIIPRSLPKSSAQASPVTFSHMRRWVLGYSMPKVSYALFLWRPTPAALAHQLDAILIQPVTRILQLPQHCHLASIQQQCNLPSLATIQQRQLLSFAVRTRTLPAEHTSRQLLSQHYAQHLNYPQDKPLYCRSYAADLHSLEQQWRISWENPAYHTDKAALPSLFTLQQLKQFTALSAVSATVRRLQSLYTRAEMPAYLLHDSPFIAAIRTSARFDCWPTAVLRRRRGQVADDACPNCLPLRVPETLTHCLLHCPHHSAGRDKLQRRIPRLLPATALPTLSLHHLLGADQVPAAAAGSFLPLSAAQQKLLLSASTALLQVIYHHLQARI
jgi:hypothetical protein